MAKKKIVKNTSGQIIDWFDETNGGWIIKKGEVVNVEKFNEFKKIEEDKRLAAQAIAFQKVDDNAPDRTQTPAQVAKVEELEKKVNDMDSKLDAILKAISK